MLLIIIPPEYFHLTVDQFQMLVREYRTWIGGSGHPTLVPWSHLLQEWVLLLYQINKGFILFLHINTNTVFKKLQQSLNWNFSPRIRLGTYASVSCCKRQVRTAVQRNAAYHKLINDRFGSVWLTSDISLITVFMCLNFQFIPLLPDVFPFSYLRTSSSSKNVNCFFPAVCLSALNLPPNKKRKKQI